MSDLFFKKSGNRVPLSPRQSSNSLKYNDLEDFPLKNGAQTSQQQSLYDVLEALCKEKKMSFFKPTPFSDYIPARLCEGKEWVIVWYVKSALTGKMVRYRKKVNRIKQISKRRAAAKSLIAGINERLAIGWNPEVSAIAPRATTKLNDALDMFLKVKQKESESNSMRSYRSFVSTFRSWMQSVGIPNDVYVCSITSDVAMHMMDDIESRENIGARTYNNYLCFFKLLFNWMIERDYISENPFDKIHRKPKKLTKKKRRLMTDNELNTLFEFLGRTNRNYLCMTLLCYCCFLRPKEIVSLKCADIDLVRQTVHIKEDVAKNDNDSYRTIPDVIVPILRELDLSNSNFFLFGGLGNYEFTPSDTQVCSRKLAKYWDCYVRPGCNFGQDLQFYSLKDTGITRMLGDGVPISFVQSQADHSSVAMTAIYVGKSPLAVDYLKDVDILPMTPSLKK